jgi:filamentous hemagglutinin
MAVTRINNNQISDSSSGNIYVGINAAVKLQNYSVTATKIANNLTYGSDLTITGNLTVQGNTTTIDTTYTTIEDPVILLASNQTGSPSVDIGFIGERGTSNNIAFVWDESATEFVTAFTSSTETNTTITISSYASLKTLNTTVTGNLSTAGFVTVTGNITGGNLNSNAQVVATGNITGGNVTTAGQIVATGNVTGGNLVTGAQVIATGNVTGGNVSTAGQVVATGNVTGGNLITAGLGSFGTTVSATGNITGGNLTSNAQVVATGNITGGNLVTAGQVVATGNITGGNLSAGSGIISTTGNVNVGNLNATTGVRAITGYFTGNVDVLGNLNATVGVVYANSGIFYGNTVTGNNAAFAGVPGFTQLGSNVVMQFAGNVNAYSQLNFENINSGTQASTDFILTADNGTDGANFFNMGITGSNWDGTQPNSLGNALRPNDGYLYADSGNVIIGTTLPTDHVRILVGGDNNNFVVAEFHDPQTNAISVTTGTLTINGGIGANGNVYGTNLYTPGLISATGNVTGGNVSTGGQVTATGNVTGGNLVTAGQVVATGNITSSANISGGNIIATTAIVVPSITVSGNITGGNLLTAGQVTATGNITSSANVSGANLIASANLVSAGAAVSGNITGGNLLTSGRVVATGNIVSSANIAGGNLAVTGTITSATLETTGNVLIGGNLTVQGNIQYVNVDDLRVEDPIIIMGTGPNGAPLVADDGMDRGIFLEWYKTGRGNSWIGWDNSSGNLVAAANVNFVGNNLVNVNTYGTFQVGNIYSQTAVATGNITGGNLITAGLAAVTGNITSSANISGANLVASANLVSVGAAVSGNITGGNLLTAGQVIATGNVTGGNVSTAGQVVATGNITGGNLVTAGLGSFGTTVSVTGNITGGNLTSNAQVVATGNITGGNLVTAGLGSFGTTVTATGNVIGGNLVTAGQVSATGNITGGNVSTGIVTASGNINGTGAVFSGNVTAANFIGNISGNIDAGGANTNIQFNDGDILAGSAALTFNKTTNAVSATGNVTAGNLLTGGLVSATGNVTGGNLVTAGQAAVTGNITGGNINTAGQVVATGNVNGGNVIAVALVTGANVSATSNVTGANVVGTTSGNFANIRISTSSIDSNASRITINGADADVDFAIDGDTVANVFYVDAGTGTVSIGNSTQTTNAVLALNATNSFLMPVGNTAQRPGTGVTGMLRFNSTLDAVEVYDLDSWSTVGTPSFTVVTDDQFNGNGVQTVYTLANAYTTNSVIVSINGVVQIPTSAYSVTANVLTFTEAPQTGDLIDVRGLTTTTQVTSISNSPGNAVVAVSPTSAQVDITGNLSVNNIINSGANGTGNIGNSTTYFNTVFAKATSAQYADLAENYRADAAYEPGTVLSFGGDQEVTLSAHTNDIRIAGVVSTNPSYIMNSTLDSQHVVTIALTGRVPTKVTGSVCKGDMMVSAGNGYAMACATPAIGSVIGKSLESHAGGDGVIEVVVGRL